MKQRIVVYAILALIVALFSYGLAYADEREVLDKIVADKEAVNVQDLEKQQSTILVFIKAALYDISILNERIAALDKRRLELEARYNEVAEKINAIRTESDTVE